MSAGAAIGIGASILTVIMTLYAASELMQGNAEPLANMITKAILVGAFGTLIGAVLYGFVRLASEA